MTDILKEELINIDEEVENKEKFVIENLESANWAFRKLKAIEEREKDIELLANKEIERIQDWQRKEIEATKGSKDFFEGLLMEYYVKQREEDSKFKLSTPYGKVTSRKQQPKWNYEDGKTIEWLRQNNRELIRIKEEIDKGELKKLYKIHGDKVVTEDGEIVEGIVIENRDDTINVKVAD